MLVCSVRERALDSVYVGMFNVCMDMWSSTLLFRRIYLHRSYVLFLKLSLTRFDIAYVCHMTKDKLYFRGECYWYTLTLFKIGSTHTYHTPLFEQCSLKMVAANSKVPSGPKYSAIQVDQIFKTSAQGIKVKIFMANIFRRFVL